MYTLNLTTDELPIIATVIESNSTGMFASRIKRYLKNLINSTVLDTSGQFTIYLEAWPALWLLSVMYNSEVSGPSASLMYKLEDCLQSEDITAEHILDQIE